jgi:hypothetical protein
LRGPCPRPLDECATQGCYNKLERPDLLSQTRENFIRDGAKCQTEDLPDSNSKYGGM